MQSLSCIMFSVARRNKYDNELIEFWVDRHTSGVVGMRQEEGIRESTHASGSSASMALSSSEDLRVWNLQDKGGCEIEGAPEKDFWAANTLGMNCQVGFRHGKIYTYMGGN